MRSGGRPGPHGRGFPSSLRAGAGGSPTRAWRDCGPCGAGVPGRGGWATARPLAPGRSIGPAPNAGSGGGRAACGGTSCRVAGRPGVVWGGQVAARRTRRRPHRPNQPPPPLQRWRGPDPGAGARRRVGAHRVRRPAPAPAGLRAMMLAAVASQPSRATAPASGVSPHSSPAARPRCGGGTWPWRLGRPGACGGLPCRAMRGDADASSYNLDSRTDCKLSSTIESADLNALRPASRLAPPRVPAQSCSRM